MFVSKSIFVAFFFKVNVLLLPVCVHSVNLPYVCQTILNVVNDQNTICEFVCTKSIVVAYVMSAKEETSRREINMACLTSL